MAQRFSIRIWNGEKTRRFGFFDSFEEAKKFLDVAGWFSDGHRGGGTEEYWRLPETEWCTAQIDQESEFESLANLPRRPT